MKIVLVLNKPNREMEIMKSIKREILALHPDAQVEIWEMCTPVFNDDVLKFRPNVILTFPFTCTGFAAWYYIFKFRFGCKILSLRAEGVVDFKSDYLIQWAVGFDHYGKHLVDYELFWGEKVAFAVGKLLVQENKLSSLDRVKTVGYPRLESYFDVNYAPPALPERLADKIKGYRKKDILFFVTGFHLANYSRQDLFDARDLDAENKVDELLEAVEISKRYRAVWTEQVLETARQNPNMLIILKKHPIEKRENYAVLESVPNILYVYEDIEIQHLLPWAGLFFHYGSTSIVDSYLAGVPSVYVYSKANKHWYADMNFPASRRCDVSQITALVREHTEQSIPFVLTNEIKASLKDIFDIEEGKAYMPSHRIAELTLSPEPPQQIPWTDRYLWRSLLQVAVHCFRTGLVRAIKKVLRMDPNEPLLKKQCPR